MKAHLGFLDRLGPCLSLRSVWPRWAIFAAAAVLGCVSLQGQIDKYRSPETGEPLVQNFTPAEFNGPEATWGTIQDNRGITYVGSQAGILEYDGASWRTIPTPNKTFVRTFTKNPQTGRIYAGSDRDFGYLAPDAKGFMRFVSIPDKHPEIFRSFADIWSCVWTPEGVYFLAHEGLFRYVEGNESVRFWPAKRAFNYTSYIASTHQLYISNATYGLSRLGPGDDEPQPVPGFEQFKDSRRLILRPFIDDRILVLDRGSDKVDNPLKIPLYLYDGVKLTPFKSDADNILLDHRITFVTALLDGTFAIGTTGAGVLIMDPEGHILWTVDEAHGLLDNTVYSIYFNPVQPAGRRAVWINSAAGLSQVSLPPPFSVFANYITGEKLSFARSGSLYVGSTHGLYRLNAAVGKLPGFEQVKVPGNPAASALVSVSDAAKTHLLMGASGGLFEISGDEPKQIIGPTGERPYGVTSLAISRKDPHRVYVGLSDGLAAVYLSPDGTWTDEQEFKHLGGFRTQSSMLEDDAGNIWLGTQASGVFRIAPKLNQEGHCDGHAAIDHYTLPSISSDGRRVGAGIRVFELNHKLLFASNDLGHLYRLDETSGQFNELKPDDPLYSAPSDPQLQGFGFKEDSQGNVWSYRGRELVFLEKRGDRYFPTRAYPTTLGSLGTAFLEADGICWFGARKAVLRFDSSAVPLQGNSAAQTFEASIRLVTANPDDTSATEIYGGAGVPEHGDLTWQQRAIRFNFAAFGAPDQTQPVYDTYLEGVPGSERESNAAGRVFMLLPPGNYTFHVKAKSFGNIQSTEATYPFTIAAPLYRTWWAYLLYLLLLVVALWGALFLRSRQVSKREQRAAGAMRTELLESQAKALERDVQLATAEITKQAADLRQAYDTVESLSEIGREITASLNLETVLQKVYEGVSKLADATIFGVGMLVEEDHRIEYPLAMRQGERVEGHGRDTQNRNQFAVWCVENLQPVVMNDVDSEYTRYIPKLDADLPTLQEGGQTLLPASMIYVPLMTQNEALGVITIQSFQKDAYTEKDVSLLKSLATYTSIAIVNARLFEAAALARAAAEDADASKSAFLSTVSHELRTPLTSVLGFAKIIRRRLSEKLFPLIPAGDPKTASTMKQVTDNLDVVVSEGARLTKLIDEVLDLAKIEAGKLDWRMEQVTVTEIIDRAMSATSSLTDSKPVNVTAEIPPNLPGFIGDRDRLIQVVINLISNAVKFTAEGAITCRARLEGSELIVSVTDTGLGISPSDQPKVFEKFKQVGDTLTDKPKGTGLGLPICKEIVEHHKGRIWVESEIGKGSTFLFSLPANMASVAATVPAETSAPERSRINLDALVQRLRASMTHEAAQTTGKQQSVLVVDDDENIRELLRQEFQEAGYTVRLAPGGHEALSMVREEKPGLVLLDVLMPDMNGFDVAAVLKNDPETSDIPIIMLSIVQDAVRGHRLGIDRYLPKPVDTAVLFREVDALMAQGKSKKKVMIVDEDASAVKTLTEVLQLRGYHVMEGNGTDVVEQAVSGQPDVIILNSVLSGKAEIMQTLRFEKGLEHLLFLIY